MDRRTNEVPMDFEWQTHGPADITSPFYQLTQKQGLKRGFESPSKLPPLPQSPFFSAPTNRATPFRNPSFTTPRKPFDIDLFSEASGAESSPADLGDTEDTPEVRPSKTMTAFTASKIDKKPIFGRYGLSALSASPSRGDIRRGKYSDAVVQKVRKRRRVERDPISLTHGRRNSWDTDSDSEGKARNKGDHTKSSRHESSLPAQGWFGALLSGIESRPNLPHLLSYYAQLLLNSFLVSVIIYLIYAFISTIRADVTKAQQHAIAEAHHEIALCNTQWHTNNCPPHLRVPAMATACQAWELCMAADPTQVGRAKISAHTFARIFNEFIEPISWKTMAFVIATLAVCLFVNNAAFGAYREKSTHVAPGAYYAHPQQPPTPWPSQAAGGGYQWGPIGGQPPATPRRADGGYGEMGGQMFQSIMPPQTPHGSPRKTSRH